MNRSIKNFGTLIIASLIVGCFFSLTNVETYSIECSTKECKGQYEGPEFISGSDIAHQFSNKMSATVGEKLKELFNKGEYSIVDFDNIEMTTKGMGSGNVVYYLKIPFKRVISKCDAYTSFDHVGGWNHKPELEARKKQLESALMKGHKLYISELKQTPEGLQEHWIQWKNKVTQSTCN
jgi:hypothetical protein